MTEARTAFLEEAIKGGFNLKDLIRAIRGLLESYSTFGAWMVQSCEMIRDKHEPNEEWD